MVKIGIVSLGCDKNRINAEQMLWRLNEAGYEIVDTPELAEVVLVNTCAFIEAAKSEAIENILEIAAAKVSARVDGVGGNVEHIIVTGCLSERYREEILEQLPEVDAVVGVGGFDDIVAVVDGVVEGKSLQVFGDVSAPIVETARYHTDDTFSAYLKIAEGCSNHCAYCVIPSLRGRFRSREMDYIVNEARDLAAHGTKELILVAQDLTMYGADLGDGSRKLPELLQKLCEIDGFRWIRLHYLYPEGVTPALIDCIKRNPKIVRCLDIPIQHINDQILKTMRRRSTSQQIKSLFTTLRREIEGVVLRTSIIVGLPGEGEDEFEELCEFLREHHPERAGFFAFSPEEGTDAALWERPDDDTVAERLDILQDVQREIVDEYNSRCVGKVFDVLCEGADAIIKMAFGRTYADAPEIDGKVFFTPKSDTIAGDIVEVYIEDEMDGDLMGRAL